MKPVSRLTVLALLLGLTLAPARSADKAKKPAFSGKDWPMLGGTPARNLGTQAPLRRQSKKEKILEPELDGGAIPNLMACTSKNH